MARLNEPDPTTESVEILKRRFVRQNRDLTRSNATQAIRIRCLEAEISRLLTENLQLRDKKLHLQNQLDRAPSISALSDVRQEMAHKLDGLQALMLQLDGLGRDEKPPMDAGNRAVLHFEQKKQNAEAQDYNPSVERMPTIKENKSYPRRTMSLDASVDSPDMGSPPVAHYDEAVTPFQTISLQNQEPQMDTFDTTELAAALPNNLETRRKHRPIGERSTARRMEFSQSPEVKIEEGVQIQPPVRSGQGQKRKLEVREDEKIGTRVSEDAEKEKIPADFAYKTSTGRRSSTGIGRRALAHKNINPLQTAATKDPKVGEKTKDSERSNRVGRTVVIVDHKPQEPATTDIETDETAIPDTNPTPNNNPPTPLPPTDSILSPPPDSRPSSAKRPPKDTPPPFSSTPMGDPTSRRAGRARAPVSYAEPSLNTKMRRPTKEMVDAVGPTTTTHRTSMGRTEEAESPSRQRRRSVAAADKVKREPIETEGIQAEIESRPSRRISITRRQSLSAFDFVDSSPPLQTLMTVTVAEKLDRRRRSLQVKTDGERL